MKFTLLEGVQEILSDLDSDEVNSINDTVESYQVALIFKSVFYDLVNDLNLIEHDTIFGLEPSGDTTKPVLMTVPENITRVEWIKYDKKTATQAHPHYEVIKFKPFEDFVINQQFLIDNSQAAEMTVTGDNSDSFKFLYRKDAFPQWYTTYDNDKILFDALDITVDATLQKSKTLCMGKAFPLFSLEDSFVADLDPPQFRFYINRVRVRAFAQLKQTDNKDAAGEARRQKIITQKRKHRVATRPEIFSVASRFGRK